MPKPYVPSLGENRINDLMKELFEKEGGCTKGDQRFMDILREEDESDLWAWWREM